MVGQLANHLGENRLDFYTLFPFQMDNTLNIFKINHKYTRRKHECFFKKIILKLMIGLKWPLKHQTHKEKIDIFISIKISIF